VGKRKVNVRHARAARHGAGTSKREMVAMQHGHMPRNNGVRDVVRKQLIES
jgi:hypothetical protein